MKWKWKWKCSYQYKVKKVQILIIPDDVKEKMSQVTTRDLYIWGKKNGIINRLPRKTKKKLCYGKSVKYLQKANAALAKLWNEYYEQVC